VEINMVFLVMACMALVIVLIAFLVIVKTINTIGIAFLRMEYLLKRELELVRERERIKQEIYRQQRIEDDRRRKLEEESDPLLRVPYVVGKDKK